MSARTTRFAAYVVLAATAAWAGMRLYSHSSAIPSESGPIATPSAAQDIAGALQSDADSMQVGPLSTKIPEVLPAFSLSDVDGRSTSITAWRGKSLVLNFWATWCAPCREEIPLLKSLASQWAAQNVEVIGVAVDYRDKVKAYAREMGIAYPLLVGEQDALDVATALGVATPVFPFTVFTDRYGDVVTVYVGALHRTEADLIMRVVAKLDNGQTTIKAARIAIVDGLHELPPKHPT